MPSRITKPPSDTLSEADSPTKPFATLLTASSFVVAVLAVAGFSLRWNYYYNFGLQNIVLQAPIASLPVSAIEIMRTRENVIALLWLAVKVLLPFQILLFLANAATRSNRRRIAIAGVTLTRLLALDSPLIVDVIRAGLIVYVAFVGGGEAGSRDYLFNVLETTSRLPKVTAVLLRGQPTQGAGTRLPLTCDTRSLLDRGPVNDPPFIGDPQAVQLLGGGDACSSEEHSWRLLYRDDRFVYLFLTVPRDPLGYRPATLILANGDNMTLIMK